MQLRIRVIGRERVVHGRNGPGFSPVLDDHSRMPQPPSVFPVMPLGVGRHLSLALRAEGDEVADDVRTLNACPGSRSLIAGCLAPRRPTNDGSEDREEVDTDLHNPNSLPRISFMSCVGIGVRRRTVVQAVAISASTSATTGSNWVPAQARSSAIAASSGIASR